MKYIKTNNGLTLIEVMVALVLGLILITAFTGALVIGLQTEGDMDERLEARSVIDSIIEYLRNNRDDFGEDDWETNINKEYKNDIIIKDKVSFDENQNYDEDIIIVWSKSNDLYEFKIIWPDKNYSTEALISAN